MGKGKLTTISPLKNGQKKTGLREVNFSAAYSALTLMGRWWRYGPLSRPSEASGSRRLTLRVGGRDQTEGGLVLDRARSARYDRDKTPRSGGASDEPLPCLQHRPEEVGKQREFYVVLARRIWGSRPSPEVL